MLDKAVWRRLIKRLETTQTQTGQRRTDHFPITGMNTRHDDRISATPGVQQVLRADDGDAALCPQAVQPRYLAAEPADLHKERSDRGVGVGGFGAARRKRGVQSTDALLRLGMAESPRKPADKSAEPRSPAGGNDQK